VRRALRIVARSRHSWPGWLNAIADGILDRAPDRWLRRLDRMLVGRAVPIPDPPPELPGAVRLYIGPANFAGQGHQWARAVTAHVPGATAVSMAFQGAGAFGYPTDLPVDTNVYLYSTSWQRRQLRAVLGRFSHVLIEAERPLFGTYLGGVSREVTALTDAGIRVAFVCHGTDIRLPSRHAQTHPDSPYRDGLLKETPSLERRASENRRVLDRFGLPVFVSTPDLLLDVADGVWLPVAVEAGRWERSNLPLRAARPVVVHVPSKAIIKGTDLIEPVLRRLDSEGAIQYRRLEGVPAAEMPELYGSADIVVDQFRIGSYGVAACEAMAAGRLVVSHVSEQVRAEVSAATGFTLPIVESTAAALEETLLGILADPDRHRAVAASGPRFVAEVHDGRLSARLIDAHFLSGG
jgi:hypothetical protein